MRDRVFPINFGKRIWLFAQLLYEMKNPVSSPSAKWIAAVLVLAIWPLTHTIAGGTASLKSAPLTLAWNPAEDQTVKGYGVYYGPASQPATNHIDAGTNLTVTLFNLLADISYRFYAVSYDAAGNESVPSNELLVTPRLLSRLRIGRLSTGEFRLAVRAAPGSVCQLEYVDAPNLSNWQVLALVVADPLGDVVAIDPESGLKPARFYRVARLSSPMLESAKSTSLEDAWELQ